MKGFLPLRNDKIKTVQMEAGVMKNNTV